MHHRKSSVNDIACWGLTLTKRGYAGNRLTAPSYNKGVEDQSTPSPYRYTDTAIVPFPAPNRAPRRSELGVVTRALRSP
eukprot:3113843-Prymnesium_polylepis.5